MADRTSSSEVPFCNAGQACDNATGTDFLPRLALQAVQGCVSRKRSSATGTQALLYLALWTSTIDDRSVTRGRCEQTQG